jgi:acyl-coenzyme A thioesterase PaaI-like protein
MYYYAQGCSSLTKLVLPAVGWFQDNNVDWSVPASRLGVLKGHVLDSDDLSSWKALTVSGKTLHTNYIRDPDLVYYGGTEPAQGEAHITATSKLSVSGRKIAKAEAPITAVTAITAQGKKIAKAQVHITATTVLSVSGVGEEIQVEQGRAHVEALSSFDVAGEKRARSPPAVLTGETEVAAEGRKVAKGQVSLAATSDIKVTGRKVAKKDISITSDSDISIQGKKTARGTARLTGKTEPQTEGRKLAKAEIRFTADSELAAEGKKVAKGQVTLTATSEIKVTGQTFDIIHTLTFSEASGDCPIRLYRGFSATYTGTVYYRAGTSGDWTTLSVSGMSTTFPVTSTTMQIAHNWNKSGNNYMTPSFWNATNITSIAISQKSALTGTMGNFFMYYYARGCSSLTSLAVPDTSSLESVGDSFMYSYARDCSSLTSLDVPDTSSLSSAGNYFMYSYARDCSSLTSLDVPDTSSLESVGDSFMYYYAQGCSSLTKLVLPAVGWFQDNNVDWSVPASRLGVLEGHVLDSDDLSSWQALTVSGKTLHTNYIRDPDLVYYGGTEPAQGEAHITATSKLSVSGRKIAKAEAPVTAVTAITAQGKKIAKAQVHITATTVLSVSGVGEEIQVEQGRAHVEALSSFDVAGEKRARSPPAVLTVAAEGRKVAKGQVSLAATSDIKVTGRKVAKKDISITSDSDISIQGKKTARGTARLTGKTEPQTEGRKLAKAEIRFTADSELAAEGKKVAKGQVTLTATSEIKVTGQTFDIIHTLTFSEASGDCPIRLYRGFSATYTGTVYYRAGTSGDWTTLSVSGMSTTFPVTSTTMQIAHNWNKSGNNYMTPSFWNATNITSIAISQKSALTGTMGNFFMYYYARGCSSLTSLAVPDTSSLESVGDSFMYSYARDCSSLTSLDVPDTSSLSSAGNYFMYSYARDCSSLTSLDVPDTSSLESVGILSCITMLRAAHPSLNWCCPLSAGSRITM